MDSFDVTAWHCSLICLQYLSVKILNARDELGTNFRVPTAEVCVPTKKITSVVMKYCQMGEEKAS